MWEINPLSALCDVLDSRRKPITKKDRSPGPYPYYGATGILDYVEGYLFDEKLVLIGEDGAKWGAGDNSAFSIDGKTWVNNHAHVIRPKRNKVLDKWLIYYLNGEDLSDFITGMTVPKLNQGKLREIPIPLPPIPEQQRIVVILDQAFADIEKARANAEKNLKNILELYLSNKQEIFGRSNLESQMMDLTSVCEGIFAGGDAPKKGLYSKVKTDKYKIPIYANAVKDAGLYGFTDYFRVDKPSITIAARGSGTGHIELRRDSFLPIVRLIVLIPRTGILSLEYFKYALQNLDILRSGSAIPQLTVPMIKEYCIPVPSLDTQLAIIEEIGRVGGYIEECKRLYEQKLNSLDELKKSLLQKAFSGELTKTKGQAA